MTLNRNTSLALSQEIKHKTQQTSKNQLIKQKKSRVNWHEAASCALQIELREYSDFLEYQPEYILGNNSYRIDLLIIKKLTEKTIPVMISA